MVQYMHQCSLGYNVAYNTLQKQKNCSVTHFGEYIQRFAFIQWLHYQNITPLIAQ